MNFINFFREYKIPLRLIILLILLATLPLLLFINSNKKLSYKGKAAESKSIGLVSNNPVKPEFKKGEILIKFKQQLKPQLKPGMVGALDIDKQDIPYDKVDEKSLPPALVNLNKQYKVKSLEKIFKGVESPEQELNKLKRIQSQEPGRRRINEQEFLKIDLSRTYKIEIDENASVEQAIRDLSQNPEVEYAEPNYIIKITDPVETITSTPSATIVPTIINSPTPIATNSPTLTPTLNPTITTILSPTIIPSTRSATPVETLSPTPTITLVPTLSPVLLPTIIPFTGMPNDPDFSKLWGLNNIGQTGGKNGAHIDILKAWSVATSDPNIIIAVIDSGIDYLHSDLVGKIWQNTQEIPNNRIDDENNGYVDDIKGWNFVSDNNNPIDDAGHGTHVAGTIGAVPNNNIGIVGVGWSVKLMALKFINFRGEGLNSDAAQAIDYAVRMGAKIINASWGSYAYSSTIYEAIRKANESGVLFVAAAGNSSVDNDRNKHYPSSYDLPNILAVAASDHNDQLAYFSNYGIDSVDMAAPGMSIYSTLPQGKYGYKSGTSMAAPHVVGVASIIWSKLNTYSLSKIRDLLISSSDNISLLTSKIKSGGRLNAYNALTAKDLLYVPKEINKTLASDSTFKRKIYFNNFSQQNITWSVNYNASWLSLDKSFGNINTQGEDGLEMTINTNLLDSGRYTTTLNFTTNYSGLQQISIPVTVIIPPTYKTEWGKTLGGSNTDTAVSIAKDSNENIYALGNFTGNIELGAQILKGQSERDDEVFLAKYDKNGSMQWVKQIGGDSSAQWSKDIFIDKNNNIYISGEFYSSVKIDDKLINNGKNTLNTYIAKITSSGSTLWLRSVEENNRSYPKAIAADLNGNYYLGINISDQNYLIKFNTTGNEIWRKEENISDIDIDKDNNIYITGDFPLAKYSKEGDLLFKKTDLNKFKYGNALTIDNEQNIYITGYILVQDIFDPIDHDVIILKYKQSGDLLWQKQIIGDYGSEYGDAITTDQENNVYVAGRFSGDMIIDGSLFTNGVGDVLDVFFSIFDKDGQLLNFDFLSSPYEEYITSSSIMVDKVKKIYIAGRYKGHIRYDDKLTLYSNGQEDLFLMKLQPKKAIQIFPIPSNPGKAVWMDNSSYVEIADNTNKIVMTPKFTFEAWIKPEINNQNYAGQAIVFRGGNTLGKRFILSHNPDSLSQYQYSRLFFSDIWIDQYVLTNNWAHIAFVRDLNKIRFYMNGMFVQENDLGTDQPIPNVPVNSFFIGCERVGNDCNLKYQGAIDEIRLSNVVRNIEESWENNIYFNPLSTDSNTLALWRFDNNLEDKSGNNANGISRGNIKFVDGIVANPPTLSPTPTPRRICAQVITSAQNPATGECRDFPTPCDVPSGWTRVESCAVPTNTPAPTATPTPAPKIVPQKFVCNACSADINGNGYVNGQDVSSLLGCFLKKKTDKDSRGKSCANRDINGDSAINGVDLSCIISTFMKSCKK